MRKPLRNSIYLVITGCLMAACDTNTLYHSYQSIPHHEWKKSDTLLFKVPIADTLTVLRLQAEVRNGSSYNYRNLHLFVSQNLEDSTVWKTDTLELTLANPEGKWIGTGWGSLFQSVAPVRSFISPHRGNYTIKVSHGMKDDLLSGISDIGIKIEK